MVRSGGSIRLSWIPRVALTDCGAQPQLAELFAQCRSEEPDVSIQLAEVSVAEMLRGLRERVFDVGLACTNDVGEGIVTRLIWSDRLMVAMPPRHPLLDFKQVPLAELARYTLHLCHSSVCEGSNRQIKRILRSADTEFGVVENAVSLDVMLTLVSAGYGLGFIKQSQVADCQKWDLVARPLLASDASMPTYLLHAESNISAQLCRFIVRALRQDETNESEDD